MINAKALSGPTIYQLLSIPSATDIVSPPQIFTFFKPVISFAEEEPYEFIIYDKWGLEIFRTEETFEGWDGTLNYSIAPSQSYTYFVRYYDYKNKEHIKTGTFFMLVE